MAKFVLELDLEPDVIERIEAAANDGNESAAGYVERLLKEAHPLSLTTTNAITLLPDWIKELTISDKPTPDLDVKKAYGDYLMKKYSV